MTKLYSSQKFQDNMLLFVQGITIGKVKRRWSCRFWGGVVRFLRRSCGFWVWGVMVSEEELWVFAKNKDWPGISIMIECSKHWRGWTYWNWLECLQWWFQIWECRWKENGSFPLFSLWWNVSIQKSPYGHV